MKNRILYFCGIDSSFMTRWQLFHIIPEVEKIGYEIEIFNPFEFNSIKELNSAWIKKLKDNEYNIIMNCHGDNVFNEICKNALAKTSVPKILICFDNLQDPYMHQSNYKYFDITWITSEENINFISNLGAKKIIYLPYAACENLNLDFNNNLIHTNLFVGSPYGVRKRYLHKLINKKYNLDIYCPSLNITNNDSSKNLPSAGNLSRYFSHSIGRKIIFSKLIEITKKKIDFEITHENIIKFDRDFDEINEAILKSKIVFNFIELRNTDLLKTPVTKIHLKTFEIPSYGGLQLVRRTPELCSLFEDDKEIITYSSFDELEDKINYYGKLSDYKLNKLKFNAWNRVNKEHLWRHRFSKIFNEI